MTEKEAIELFEKAHFLYEQISMEQDIDSISRVLSQPFIDIYQVRHYIDKINNDHPENMLLYNIIFPAHGDRVPLSCASNDSLIQHLFWKQQFLLAKRAGKTFAELYKEVRKMFLSSPAGRIQDNGQATMPGKEQILMTREKICEFFGEV